MSQALFEKKGGAIEPCPLGRLSQAPFGDMGAVVAVRPEETKGCHYSLHAKALDHTQRHDQKLDIMELEDGVQNSCSGITNRRSKKSSTDSS
ncbi:MAG: hypothetical protein P4L43_15885 [Syntrophobacteraceae bacterium]|nr:hypothetical protein [Syntrophobacteraceae bacterium]